VLFADSFTFPRNTSPLSSWSKSKLNKKPEEAGGKLTISADFFLRLLFDSEDRGDLFLRNFGLSQNYAVLQSRRPYSSSDGRENLRSNTKFRPTISSTVNVLSVHCFAGLVSYLVPICPQFLGFTHDLTQYPLVQCFLHVSAWFMYFLTDYSHFPTHQDALITYLAVWSQCHFELFLQVRVQFQIRFGLYSHWTEWTTWSFIIKVSWTIFKDLRWWI
jgi:hypothetical protein